MFLCRHVCFPYHIPLLREVVTGQPARFAAGGKREGFKPCLNMLESTKSEKTAFGLSVPTIFSETVSGRNMKAVLTDVEVNLYE